MQNFIEINGVSFPLKVFIEPRNGARISLGAKYIILRIPKKYFLSNNEGYYLDWAKNWLTNLHTEKPNVFTKYNTESKYISGSKLIIGGETFELDIEYIDDVKASIKRISPTSLNIKIPNSIQVNDQSIIKKLLIKFFVKYFYPNLVERVRSINKKFFNVEINDIKLKYNTSNWGSCSTGKNLNFSLRLFFAPIEVQDYVIVHELSHLIEMNHSHKFWNIVESIMPEYKQYEKILNDNKHIFDF